MALGMTNYELAQLGMQGFSGLMGGMAQGNQNKLSEEERAMQSRLQAMQNLANVERGIGDQRQDRAIAYADRAPLGAEQRYAQGNAVRAAILPQLVNASRNVGGPTNPAISSRYTPPTSPLANLDISRIMQTVSPEATARAITDRRVALAGVDPSATSQLMPLSDYGLDMDGAFHRETEQRSAERQMEIDQTDAYLRDMAMKQYGLTEEQAQQMEQEGGGGGFWKKLAKVGLIAGGAALMATGVGGAAGAMLIGAGTGAASGAIDGGWQGALLGGATGALSGGLGGGGAQAGIQAARDAGATTSQLIRQSILNPRTLGQMTGAAVGGRTGQMINLGSNFLPGPNFNAGRNTRGGFEGNDPEIGNQALGLGNVDTNVGNAPQLASRGVPGAGAQLPAGLQSANIGNGRMPQRPRPNFITPQDLQLAGGGRPDQLNPFQMHPNSAPDPRWQQMFGGSDNPNMLQRLGLQNMPGVSGGMPSPPFGQIPSLMGNRVLQGQIVGPTAGAGARQVGAGSGQSALPGGMAPRGLPSGPTPRALPSGPAMPRQLPPGQYNMPQNALPPQIPLGSSPLNAQHIRQLQELLSRMGANPNVIRQLIMRSGGQ